MYCQNINGSEIMKYKILQKKDIEKIIPMYVDYYNNHEECEWNKETTYKRISQVVTKEDSLCFQLLKEDEVIGLAIGYFEQYDDGIVYDLIEIVIKYEYQNQKIGTTFMGMIESEVKSRGGFMVQLTAVNDEWHNHFYGKLGYNNCNNLVLKSKIL